MIKKVKTRSQNFSFYVKERLGQIMTLRNWEERTPPKRDKTRKEKQTQALCIINASDSLSLVQGPINTNMYV
jgi:hypothetical protein